MPQFSGLFFLTFEREKHEKFQQFKIRFLATTNKVVRDKDKVTLMSYEKCQHFAIAFFPRSAAALLKSEE